MSGNIAEVYRICHDYICADAIKRVEEREMVQKLRRFD